MLNIVRWKATLILVTAFVTMLLAAPNIMPQSWVDQLPKALRTHMTLGLDLQGGVHLILQVDADAVRRERLEALREDVRRVLRDARVQVQSATFQGNGVVVRLREGQNAELANTELRKIPQPLGGVFSTSGQYDFEVSRQGDVFTVNATEAGLRDRLTRAVSQSIEIIRRRVDQLGTTEPVIQRQGADRILVQVPGEKDPQRLKNIIGTTAKLEFRLVDQSMPVEQALAGRAPADSIVLYEEVKDNGRVVQQVPYLIQRRVIVTGEDLVDAQAAFNAQQAEWVVNFRFNSSGGRKFAQVTQENVNRPFAIVLDNKVISAPVIREPILGGSGQISGRFTADSAANLALLLRAGALPAPLTVVEERTVGASLGADSVTAGTRAAIIGSIFVVIFMFMTYGLFGLFANIAVVVNVTMMFGLLSLVGATLTLPGIAGVVLTVGMAVDSNVLIFERIREEARHGRSVMAAIDTGFTKAIGTIMDANITQFLTAVILFYLGTGPVKGFALTLGLGIITTMFTAITFTRFLVVLWLRWFKPVRIPM
ncbi:protein translocase subunit SecD [Phreatobacter sp. AB_2022a]|uniref:protein translocase subunit SecD n=1 Tax=Phreatobacter sp. AB_2022a TaxID=3003134 RepID=UPI0005717484|nr:protein translocase subunit SecD [Phreatobacter sp. AB_2022a]MCZ0736761.1 protein translocase subunit SecD [Phreatobacter sp. AB_2022a]CEJ13326.1 Protein translocase subunit SecD [bacterium YEK0313]